MNEFFPDSKMFFKSLTEERIKEILNRVRYFTYSNYGKLEYYGVDLEDLIQQAILDTYSGKRTWKPGVDPVAFLCMVVRSKVTHVVEKEVKKGPTLEPSEIQNTISFQSLIPSPQSSYSGQNVEESMIYNDLCNRIQESVCADPLLTKIVRLLRDEPDLKLGEMADALNEPESNVHNGLRRLKRKIEKLTRRWNNGKNG